MHWHYETVKPTRKRPITPCAPANPPFATRSLARPEIPETTIAQAHLNRGQPIPRQYSHAAAPYTSALQKRAAEFREMTIKTRELAMAPPEDFEYKARVHPENAKMIMNSFNPPYRPSNRGGTVSFFGDCTPVALMAPPVTAAPSAGLSHTARRSLPEPARGLLAATRTFAPEARIQDGTPQPVGVMLGRHQARDLFVETYHEARPGVAGALQPGVKPSESTWVRMDRAPCL
ncbi:hypothetical protein PAPYR_10595 [Paratrimastix pyriformis]|uniref:Uncharacterized protein n=1 Tax=Paratrimastix pyriformis TaxID=342808 RepID=A0ABQ8UCR2_9EUKA|nr:hypothetical protein PAPYR_10595 [Paratrimastix pyriformis]